jgi:CheY-like chemotaxis protein
VVDDDSESRELLREVLSTSGYSVEAVESVSAACSQLSQDGECRIVIADLRMPDGTGLELLRHLRQGSSRREMILMSSFISAAQRKLALELGADALLEKPFQLSELIRVVGELAARRPVIAAP